MVSLVKRKIGNGWYYYAIWNARVNGKVKRVRQVYLGTAKNVISRLTSGGAIKLVSRAFGSVAVLLHAAESIGLVETFNNALGKADRGPSVGEYLLLPVINRLIEPTSKRGLCKWFESSCLPWLWNKRFSLSSQTYWNYLDKIGELERKTIWRTLVKNARKGLEAVDDAFLFDATNFFTYIDDHEGNELLKKGKSKQHRSDKNLVAVSLVVGEQSGLPYDSFTYAGNVFDSKHFPNVAGDVSSITGVDATLVLDKGNWSEDNAKVFKQFKFVSSLRKSMAKDLLQVSLNEFKTCYTTPKGRTVLAYAVQREVYGMDCRLVVTFNKALAKKQRITFEKEVEKGKTKLAKLVGKKFKSTNSGVRAVEKVLPKNARVFAYSFTPAGKGFRLAWSVDAGKVGEREAGFGKNIVFTNQLGWSDERVVKAYRSMYKVEDDFKILHGALLIPMKPFFHWTDQKIRAHIFLCMTALLLGKVLELHARKAGVVASFKNLLREAEGIRLAVVVCDDKPRMLLEQVTPEQEKLVSIFGLKRFIPGGKPPDI